LSGDPLLPLEVTSGGGEYTNETPSGKTYFIFFLKIHGDHGETFQYQRFVSVFAAAQPIIQPSSNPETEGSTPPDHDHPRLALVQLPH